MPVVEPWPGWPACPCECGVEALKLKRNGHVIGCRCRPCIGTRNKRKGYKTEARGHKRLGGKGGTVRDDLYHAYSLNHSVEMKGGAQVPQTFINFILGAWIKDAMGQAVKKIPVGSDALPSVLIELSPSRAYLVTDVSGKELRE